MDMVNNVCCWREKKIIKTTTIQRDSNIKVYSGSGNRTRTSDTTVLTIELTECIGRSLALVSVLNMRDKVGTSIRLVMNAEEMANIRSYFGSQST